MKKETVKSKTTPFASLAVGDVFRFDNPGRMVTGELMKLENLSDDNYGRCCHLERGIIHSVHIDAPVFLVQAVYRVIE